MEKIKSETAIEIKKVSRVFSVPGGEFQALKNIEASIPAGNLIILKGRSGSGKTTLLNIISSLDQASSGSVFIEGKDIGKMTEWEREILRRTKFGFVFQSVSLFPTMNALQNVEFSLRMAGVKENRKSRAEECLKMVGLGNRMHHMPAEMSGGEQQRTAIARAIAHRPAFIFADEPTAELDSAMSAEVVRLFKSMTEEGITVLMTTHDMGLMDAGDTVIELQNGEQIWQTQ